MAELKQGDVFVRLGIVLILVLSTRMTFAATALDASGYHVPLSTLNLMPIKLRYRPTTQVEDRMDRGTGCLWLGRGGFRHLHPVLANIYRDNYAYAKAPPNELRLIAAPEKIGLIWREAGVLFPAVLENFESLAVNEEASGCGGRVEAQSRGVQDGTLTFHLDYIQDKPGCSPGLVSARIAQHYDVRSSGPDDDGLASCGFEVVPVEVGAR